MRGIEALRVDVEFIPVFFLAYMVMGTVERLRGVALVLVLTAAANGVVGFIQVHLTASGLAQWGPGYATLVGTGIVNGHAHAAATFVNASGKIQVRPPALGAAVGFGGALGSVALPFAFALAIGGTRRRDRLIGVVTIPLIVEAIISSQTRSALLSAVVAVVAFLVLLSLRHSARAAPASILIALAVVAVLLGGVSLARYSSITPAKLFSTFSGQRGGSFSDISTYATFNTHSDPGSVPPVLGSSPIRASMHTG